MKCTEDSIQELRQDIDNLIKTLDLVSKEVTIYGEHTGPYRYPVIRITHQDQEGTHVVLVDEDFDVSNEMRVDWISLEEVHKKMLDTLEYKKLEAVFRRRFGERSYEYLNDFITEIIEGNLDEEEIISRAIQEILYLPSRWDFKLYIQGLIIKHERIELDEFIIRKPTSSDFGPHTPWSIDDDSDVIPVHVVIEWASHNIRKGNRYMNERGAEVARILTKLRLVKAGQYKVSAWTAIAPSLFDGGNDIIELASTPFFLGLSPLMKVPSITHFEDSDCKQYERYRLLIFPSLEKSHNREIGFAINILNEIAWRTYDESLLFCIIGLESLYMENEPELRLKLSTRVTALLDYFKLNSEVVYDDIWNSYNLRNRFVHGGTAKKQTAPKDEALLARLVDYLRLSIVIWSQILEKIKYKDFIRILDKSIFSNTAKKQMESILQPVMI